MTTKQAQMEAERNAAEEEYFLARHGPFRKQSTFSAGYERGWNERNKKVLELQKQLLNVREIAQKYEDRYFQMVSVEPVAWVSTDAQGGNIFWRSKPAIVASQPLYSRTGTESE